MRTIVALLLSATSFAPLAADARKTFTFGNISIGTLKEAEIKSGCGCLFSHPPSKDIGMENVVVHWANDEPAHMFVNGRLLTLKVDNAEMPHDEHLNQVMKARLTSKTATARLSVKATSVCPPNSEGCAVTNYQGVLNIHVGKASAAVPVAGECGC